jgi:hypothetical protein
MTASDDEEISVVFCDRSSYDREHKSGFNMRLKFANEVVVGRGFRWDCDHDAHSAIVGRGTEKGRRVLLQGISSLYPI